MTRACLALLTCSLLTAACGTSSPTELTPLPSPVDNCTNNPACTTTVAAPVAIVFVYTGGNGAGGTLEWQAVADSATVLPAVFFPERASNDQMWTAAKAVYVRLTNGTTRPANDAQLLPLDPAVLEVDGTIRYRMTRAGCTKLQIRAEGLSTWVWVATTTPVSSRNTCG